MPAFYKRDTPMLMSNGVITPGRLEAPIFRLPFLYRNRAGLRECPGNYEGEGGTGQDRTGQGGVNAIPQRGKWTVGHEAEERAEEGAAWNLAFPARASS